MKKYYRLFVIFLVLSCWIPYVASAQVVNVPDPNLAAALRETLGLAPNAPITRQDMQRLIGFEAINRQIRDLTGLEHAPQLIALDLGGNQISDIRPLAGLTHLGALSLAENHIRDISPLVRMTQLEWLFLWDNQISDIRPLADLVQLERLNLTGNQVINLIPLARLTRLTELYLDRNRILSINPLARLPQLKWLALKGNQISDLNPLARMTQLERLALENNQIRDVTPLAKLTSLTHLFLKDNQIRDVTALAGLVNLRQLILAGNPIQDTSPLASLKKLDVVDVKITAPTPPPRPTEPKPDPPRGTNLLPDVRLAAAVRETLGLAPDAPITKQVMQRLTTLDADDFEVKDLTGLEHAARLESFSAFNHRIGDLRPLENLVNLRSLSLMGAGQISDLRSLKNLTNLRSLDLSGSTQISDFTPLAKLPNLTSLTLFSTNIDNRDLTSIAMLTNLTSLGLGFNNISDVSPLAKLTNLTWLSLIDNNISDVSPLAELTNLTWLAIRDNPITDTSPLANLTKLVDVDIEITAPLKALIPDANLAAAVREALDLASNALITEQAIQGLTRLDASNRQITNLTGLEDATQLEWLNLIGNRISDVSPLAGLTQLAQLGLSNNEISDMSPLAELTQLEVLHLNNNEISDVSPLAELTRLRVLGLAQNEIRDVSPLSGLVNLERLRLAENPIIDTSPLASLTKLVEVDIDISIDESVDVLIYTGGTWWITRSEAIAEAETTKRLLQSKGIQAEITDNENTVKQWMLQTASDGSVDVLILYGLIPTTIYPPGNAMPNGSVAENWIETRDGNTILNHADYFGYWSTGNINFDGQVGQRNGDGTLRNLMDDPNIFIPANVDNIPMFVTTDGRTLTPSLVNFRSDRAFPLDQLRGKWFAEKIFASNTGNIRATLADPVILRDGNRGRLAIVHQTSFENNPKGEVAAEIIINYLFTEPTLAMVSVSPSQVPSPAVGEQLTFSLNITKGENVAGYQATVQFDATALRYVESNNGDYLPPGAFFVPPVTNGNRVELASTALSGVSNGDGTLATLTFEVVAAKASTLTLTDVLLADSDGDTVSPQVESGQVTEPARLAEDVNSDGVVNIQDLVLVASNFGQSGGNTADVNGDSVVNITDLVKVAGALGNAAAAPSLHPQLLQTFTASDVRQWLSESQHLDLTDTTMQTGVHFLEQLLAVLIPNETALLSNYPNPFNPETWIPYQLAKPADVTLTIYAVNGLMIRRLSLGHQLAGVYQSRSRAAYWDGKNEWGEPVASGVYFYTLTAGDFTATRKMLILK